MDEKEVLAIVDLFNKFIDSRDNTDRYELTGTDATLARNIGREFIEYLQDNMLESPEERRLRNRQALINRELHKIAVANSEKFKIGGNLER